MRYGQIAELLNGIAERFGWDKIMEGDNVIGLKQVNCFFFYYLSFILVNTKDTIILTIENGFSPCQTSTCFQIPLRVYCKPSKNQNSIGKFF